MRPCWLHWMPALLSALVEGLTCMTCQKRSYMGLYHNEMNRFRLVLNMPRPFCRYLEPIQCDRDQTLCSTVTMNMGEGHGWWIGMGCAKRSQLKHMGCEQMQSDTTLVQPEETTGRRDIKAGRQLQTVCVCDKERCNWAPRTGGFLLLMVVLLVVILC